MQAHEHLKTIRFNGEMLPKAAQLLDLAARFCSVTKSTSAWFSHLTNSAGVDDASTVTEHCECLRNALQDQKTEVIAKLQKTPQDEQAAKIFSAWIYSLETMLQQASAGKTCLWVVEGLEEKWEDGDGEISLFRV